jgi:SAM-dependent methyltransferase
MESSSERRGVEIVCDAPAWQSYIDRWRGEEWRTSIFVDMILRDAAVRSHELTFLDIGCGRGFDDDPVAQKQLAGHCARYIGIEPDNSIAVGDDFDEVQHCLLEESSIAAESIDIAWAVMVLEHVEDPAAFWRKIYEVLRPGGVFWAFTVDNRHPLPWIVRATDVLGVKDWYLRRLRRCGSGDDYEHYPTHYHSNSPSQITPSVQMFRRCDFVNFARVGQLDGYLPGVMRPAGRLLDRAQIAVGWPGVLLAIRCEK